jgi:hypothetical protein
MLGRYAPLLLMLTVLAGPAAQAQTDTAETRRDAAKALIKAMDELTGPERSIRATNGAMRQGMQQQLAADQRLTPAQKQRAADVMTEEMTAAVTDMMREVMPTVYAGMEAVYVQHFSLLELQELQRFYTSPLGRKSVNVMMEDMPRLMQPMLGAVQAQAPKLQQRMEAASERLRAEGIDLKPAKP